MITRRRFLQGMAISLVSLLVAARPPKTGYSDTYSNTY